MNVELDLDVAKNVLGRKGGPDVEQVTEGVGGS